MRRHHLVSSPITGTIRSRMNSQHRVCVINLVFVTMSPSHHLLSSIAFVCGNSNGVLSFDEQAEIGKLYEFCGHKPFYSISVSGAFLGTLLPPTWNRTIVSGPLSDTCCRRYHATYSKELGYSLRISFDVHVLQRQFRLCIPFLGIARPQPQFLHSCVCEWFIYSQDRSTYFLQPKRQTHRGNI